MHAANRRLWMPLCAVYLLLAALLVLPGCGPKKKKSELRAEKGLASLDELTRTRRSRLLAMLPAGDTKGDDEHPWLAWMKKGISVASPADYKAVAVTAARTPMEDKAGRLADWLAAQKRFYIDERLSPNEYMRDLLGAERTAKDMPWEQDVAFEKVFFHAAELARTYNLFHGGREPHDDRVTRFFTYWKYAFDFKPKSSLFDEETNRLCAEKLGDFCKDIPMEERPFQVMKPYCDKIIEDIAAFKTAYVGSPYIPLLDRIAAVYTAKKSEVPAWSEEPVLAEVLSTLPAPVGGNALLYVTEEGVALMDNVLRKPDDPDKPWKPDWTADPAIAQEISVLAEDVRSNTVSQFNQSDILIIARKDIPVSYLEPMMRATVVGDHAKEWRIMLLVGRRRADGSNRRAAYVVSVLSADKAVKFPLTGVDGKKHACTAWAVVGRDPLEAKGFSAAIWSDGKDITTGSLAEDGTLRSPVVSPAAESAARLETWADQQTRSIVVAVPSTLTWEFWLQSLNGVALRCDMASGECIKGRNQPVFLATCES